MSDMQISIAPPEILAINAKPKQSLDSKNVKYNFYINLNKDLERNQKFLVDENNYFKKKVQQLLVENTNLKSKIKSMETKMNKNKNKYKTFVLLNSYDEDEDSEGMTIQSYRQNIDNSIKLPKIEPKLHINNFKSNSDLAFKNDSKDLF